MINFIECENVVRHYKRTNHKRHVLSESQQYIIDKETGTALCSVEEFRRIIENLMNARFNVFIGVDETHDLVFQCKKCGTVVWGGTDHRLDPYLNCPHCQDYKTTLPYWTKEEIDADLEKATDVASIIEHSTYWEESRQRYIEKGLHDWEIWRKESRNYIFSLTVNSVYYTRGKGLTFHMCNKYRRWEKRKEIIIPLTLMGMYNLWIFPFTKKGKEINSLPF